MKKILLFLPIVVLLFLFQPTFNAKAVVICPYFVGDPTCGTINDRPSSATKFTVTNVGPDNQYSYRGYFDELRDYYYKFTAPITGTYDTYVMLMESNRYIDATFLDSNQNVISAKQTSDYIHFGKISLTFGQIYYFRLHSYWSDFVNFSIEMTIDDLNNVTNPTNVTSIPSTTSANINFVGDVDYYTFTHNGNAGFYDINISGVDVKSKLYEDGKLLSCGSEELICYSDGSLGLTRNRLENYYPVDVSFLLEIQYLTSTGSYEVNIQHINDSNTWMNPTYVSPSSYLSMHNSIFVEIGICIYLKTQVIILL